ncbi:MAG TPA: tripartite tricarboxylate transporter substrate binding protein [Burkholderiaceae bacterium]|nr:tripartite tricarboxylate transporter substrate binding protein [Burkholderiaceae bacterium]
MNIIRRSAAAIVVGLAALPVALPAAAQGFPNRPIRIIVPTGPGSASDSVPRLLAEPLSAELGQPVIVMNRPGGSTTIGNEFVAKSPPDGYTLLVSTAGMIIAATAFKDLKYDTAAFASVTVLTRSPLGLAANLDFPPRTVRELIDYAKAHPNKVSFGSLGVGTSHQVTGEKLKLEASIDMVHVPYKGSGAAHMDLMGGQIQIMFDNLVSLMPHFKAGKLRPLAVTSAKRHPQLPDVPTLAESGLKDFEAQAWFGIVAPPGTPKDVLARLNEGFVKVLAMPEIRRRLTEGGSEVIGNSPEAADRFLLDELERWGSVIKAANIRIE